MTNRKLKEKNDFLDVYREFRREFYDTEKTPEEAARKAVRKFKELLHEVLSSSKSKKGQKKVAEILMKEWSSEEKLQEQIKILKEFESKERGKIKRKHYYDKIYKAFEKKYEHELGKLEELKDSGGISGREGMMYNAFQQRYSSDLKKRGVKETETEQERVLNKSVAAYMALEEMSKDKRYSFSDLLALLGDVFLKENLPGVFKEAYLKNLRSNTKAKRIKAGKKVDLSTEIEEEIKNEGINGYFKFYKKLLEGGMSIKDARRNLKECAYEIMEGERASKSYGNFDSDSLFLATNVFKISKQLERKKLERKKKEVGFLRSLLNGLKKEIKNSNKSDLLIGLKEEYINECSKLEKSKKKKEKKKEKVAKGEKVIKVVEDKLKRKKRARAEKRKRKKEVIERKKREEKKRSGQSIFKKILNYLSKITDRLLKRKRKKEGAKKEKVVTGRQKRVEREPKQAIKGKWPKLLKSKRVKKVKGRGEEDPFGSIDF